jgi:hypothetical protein
MDYENYPNLIFIVPMEEIVLQRNSYDSKKLRHYISEEKYNTILKEINTLIIAKYFQIINKTNRLLFPIIKYFIIIILIASIVCLYLTIKEQITYINYILIGVVCGLFLFCVIYVYKKEITHMKIEQSFIWPVIEEKLKELNQEYDSLIKWVYDPYRIKMYILRKDF